MSLRLGTTARNNAANAIVQGIDVGTPPGKLKVYTGAQPTNVSDNPSGTLLATLTFSNPSFGSAATGVCTASAITSDTNAAASGTAGHATINSAAGTPLMDMTCGQGSGDLSFDNSAIVAGGTVACSSMTLTQPT